MTVKAGGMRKRGAEAVADEKKEEESKFNPKDYSCEILLEKTCLLYTSPSPRDRQKSRMPSSA